VDTEIRHVLGSLLDVSEIHTETPLMDVGLDSLAAVQFRNSLQDKI
jgi:acyl carrier protein